MLTGLELQAWERAGYFIRRGHLPAEAIHRLLACQRYAVDGDIPPRLTEPLLADPTTAALIVDLLGPSAGLLSAQIVEHPKVGTWRRGGDVPLTAPPIEQAARLAGEATSLVVSAALTHAEWLWVLPGTHSQAPTEEQDAAIRAGAADVPAQVRIRLAPGDALFRDARLPTRTAEASGMCAQCAFAATSRRPHTSVPAVVSDDAIPEPIRSAFRAALPRLPDRPA